jgi:hypothetical protein
VSAGAPRETSPDPGPFVFFTELHLGVVTGVVARDLPALRDGLASVPGSSVFHHTHQSYLAQHFQAPVYYNDVARWLADALREHALAEKIAALDMLSFTSVRQLREAMLSLIDERLAAGGTMPEAPDGEAFYFCRSKSFILPSGLVARTVPDLFRTVEMASHASLFFHFFESRLRLGRPVNNFSDWLIWKGRADLAADIDALDPYVRTLDELRADIAAVGRKDA